MNEPQPARENHHESNNRPVDSPESNVCRRKSEMGSPLGGPKSPFRRQSRLSPAETPGSDNQSVSGSSAEWTSNGPPDDERHEPIVPNDGENRENHENHRPMALQQTKSLDWLPNKLTSQFEQMGFTATDPRGSVGSRASSGSRRRSRIVIRKFQKLDESLLTSSPAPDVKIGQRVSYKEYYGNEFGTIRWIGRVPQICPDWTVGVEFDNAIGEGDGSLNGRRYFIAKDCFAKFLPLYAVKLVDQHVGRPEPGTMISVMSAAVRPGQMISIQRVSTVHVQHCFLNAPHRRPGADILAVNTRLHCQCPNCGPCAHVIKPPRTQRLARSSVNATHMCQFSTYTCCGMESQEETMCTYQGNKQVSLPLGPANSIDSRPAGLPPIGNSWFEGAGYLTNLQLQQSKLMPEEYRLGAVAPEDLGHPAKRTHRRRGSGRKLTASNNNCHCEANIKPTHPVQPQSDCLEEPNFATTNKSETPPSRAASSKKVHRDSIENRYLFPTDDSIDSNFEQDLDNLSQARYGRCDHHHQRQTGNLTHTKNILIKSLRSLVSCLNSQTDSEFESASCLDCNERTINYSNNKLAPVKAINKSIPIELLSEQNEEIYSFYEENEKPNVGSWNSPLPEVPPSPPNAIEFQPNPAAAAASATGRKEEAYSSSDCGFSDCSNGLVSSTTEDWRVYERILSKLINSSSLSSEDTLKLRSILDEGHNCCLHNKPIQAGTSDLDQTIADVIKKSYLSREAKLNGTPRPNSATSCQRNGCPPEVKSKQQSSLIDTSSAESMSLNSGSIGPFETIEAKSLKLETKSNENVNLPKSLELKLTLLISDKMNNSSSGGGGGLLESVNKVTAGAESALSTSNRN